MNAIDVLISKVKDVELRQNILSSIEDLKKRQNFGLVFEEHIPETCSIYGLPVHQGSLVQIRSDVKNKTIWQVQSIDLERNQILITKIENNESKTVPTEDLLIVETLGEPIYPILTPISSIEKDPDKSYHAVINGENYHTLQLLRYLFDRQIDCIYIDPPYNTGARDWTYNNHYVDSNDTWRHSKWLSFMKKRLLLSKDLLKEDGVLIVTIDEHEIHHLGMLLEKIFPEYLRYMITIVINPKGTAKVNFARVEEYAFFIVPDLGYDIIEPRNIQETLDDLLRLNEDYEKYDNDIEITVSEIDNDKEVNDKWEIRHARRRGTESSYRHQRPNQFYPIYIDEVERKVIRVGNSISLEEEPDFTIKGGFRPIWPIDLEGHHRVWGFIPETMQSLIDEDRVILGTYNKKHDSWTINYKVPKKLTKKIKTVWWTKGYDAGTHGTQVLRKLLGEPGLFPFPKSIYAVRDCLAAVTRNRPNALILDFFAGSGTTFHSTCLLNAIDGGNRRSILVTNNEVSIKTAKKLNKMGLNQGDEEYEKEGIFYKVTLPRCTSVITGRTPTGEKILGNHLDSKGRSKGRPFSKGFEENIEFYNLDYLSSNSIELGYHDKSFLPMLWLASGGIGSRSELVDNADYYISPSNNFALLFNEAKFREFKNIVSNKPMKNIWIFTDSEEAYKEMSTDLPISVKTSHLYKSYLYKMRQKVK